MGKGREAVGGRGIGVSKGGAFNGEEGVYT